MTLSVNAKPIFLSCNRLPVSFNINAEIFETIYFAALTESNAIAAVDGTYESYPDSPVSKGILQPDMWGVTEMPGGDRHDWTGLREKIAANGVRNSLLVAPMPTASTSQILGNNECFEPYTSNIYARRVLSGEFTVVNNHLLNDLTELGLWDPSLKNDLIANNGSVQGLDLPEDLKAIYKTVWEIKQRVLVDMAADRGAFIDQSQSFNVHMSDANSGKLTSLHFYAWKKGLKTGMYYLRSRAAADAVKAVTLAQEITDYIVRLVRATRETPDLSTGASPRSAVLLANAGRARAALDGRDYAVPDDIKQLATAVLRHRVTLSPAAEIEGREIEHLIGAMVEQTEAPR